MDDVLLTAPEGSGLHGNPASLLYLACYLRKNGVNCVIERDSRKIAPQGTIGISVTTPTYLPGLELARKLKSINRECRIVMGGPHTTSQGSIISRHDEIDHIVEGPGEEALVSIVKGDQRRVIKGTAQITFPAIDDLIQTDPTYFDGQRQFGKLNYLSSRGCVMKCGFCASAGNLVRNNTESILDDLEYLAQKGYQDISMQDNHFCSNRSATEAVCDGLLERNISIRWDCQTRVESAQDIALLCKMKEAGCEGIYLGVENFDRKMLVFLGKTNNPGYADLANIALDNCRKAGINSYVNLQVGIPGEDEQIMSNNLFGLKSMQPTKVFPHVHVLYPGTAECARYVDQGMPEEIFEQAIPFPISGVVHGAGGIPIGLLRMDALRIGKIEYVPCEVQRVKQYLDDVRTICSTYTEP